ncbi:MAG: hypothetical protein ACI395_04375 [Candidatus Cryptobacteroides sp.]
MKEIFDFRRFGKYFVADLKGCAANYGLSLLIISLSGVMTYLISGVLSLCVSGHWGSLEGEFRFAVFCVAAIVLVVTMPVKCYGSITDRRGGSSYILLPASTFEKYLSMLLNCIVIIPGVFAAVFLSFDWLLTVIDPALERSTSEVFGKVFSLIMAGSDELAELTPKNLQINPFSGIDDVITTIMVFLLGAICFKKSKTAKTILTLMGVGIAVSMVISPIAVHWFSSHFQEFTPEVLNGAEAMELFTDTFKTLEVVDTILDITILAGLLVATYLRLKTIKH